MKKRLLRLILGYQKCGNFLTIVKNEVTVDVSGMVTYPLGGLYLVGMSSLAYNISYGVGLRYSFYDETAMSHAMIAE